jgi:hypothetical protein
MSRVLCVLAVMASSAAGCTGDPSNEDLTVLADAMTAVDDARAAAARDALAPTSIGVGGDTFNVWPASGVPMTGASRSIDSDGVVSFANGYWSVTIPVDAGTTLELAANVRDNGPATSTPSNTVSMSLMAYSAMSVVTLANASSDGSGKPQTLSVVSDHVVGPAELILLRFTPLAPTTPPTFATMFSQIRTITITRRRTTTISLPLLVASGALPAAPSGIDFAGNGHGVAVGIPVAIGDHIVGARAQVTDSLTGPTRVMLQLSEVTNGISTIDATSPLSRGLGLPESVGLSGLDIVAMPSHSYWAYVGFPFSGGTATSRVSSIEVDLRH